MNCDKARNTLTCLVLTAHSVSRALGSYHNNVYVLRRLDTAEMNIEAVSKSERLALGEIGLDALAVELRLLLIVDKYHNDVRCRCRLCCSHYLEPLCLCLCPALRAVVKSYDDVDARVLEVERVCVALRAVSDYCDGLAFKLCKVAVLLIVNVLHNN